MSELLQFAEGLFCFTIFIIKKCLVFSLTSFGTLKHNSVIKTIEMFNLLSLISNSATTWVFY